MTVKWWYIRRRWLSKSFLQWKATQHYNAQINLNESLQGRGIFRNNENWRGCNLQGTFMEYQSFRISEHEKCANFFRENDHLLTRLNHKRSFVDASCADLERSGGFPLDLQSIYHHDLWYKKISYYICALSKYKIITKWLCT